MRHCSIHNLDYFAQCDACAARDKDLDRELRTMPTTTKKGIGLSHGNNWEELAALADHIDRLYGTELTVALTEMVRDVCDELRLRHKCQYCGDVTTRWMCDKPHIDN